MELKTQLFNLRREKGLTVRELSDKVNVNRAKKIHFSNISKYEKGDMSLSLDIFTDLVKAMNMDVKTSVIFPKSELTIDDLPYFSGTDLSHLAEDERQDIIKGKRKELLRDKVVRIDGLRYLICGMNAWNRQYLLDLYKPYVHGQAVLFCEKPGWRTPLRDVMPGSMTYNIGEYAEAYLPSNHAVIHINTLDFDKLVDVLDFYREEKSKTNLESYLNILSKIKDNKVIEFSKPYKEYSEKKAVMFYNEYGINLNSAPEFRINNNQIEILCCYYTYEGFKYYPYCQYLGELEDNL